MFKLSYLEVGPFRSFIEPQRITFPDSGLFCIQGKNLNTGGSSGTGKSNLLLAIEYAFGSCPLPSTVLGSWFSDEPPTVKLGVKANNQLVELYRAKGLTLTKNGEEFAGSAKQKDEELLKIIGLSPEVRQSLTYRGQKKPGIFLNKTNGEKSDFLMPLLDLERFEKANNISDETIKSLKTKLENLSGSLQTLQETRSGIKLVNCQDLFNKIHDNKILIEQYELQLAQTKENQEVARIKAESDAVAARDHYLKVNVYSEQLKELGTLSTSIPKFIPDETELNRLNAVLIECQQRLSKLKEKNTKDLAEFNEKKKSIQAQINKNNLIAGSMPQIQKEHMRLENQIAVIKQNKCPTCNQEWIENQEKLKLIQHELVKVISSRLACQEAQLAVSKLQQELDELGTFEPNPTIAKLEAINNDYLVKIGEEKQKLSAAQKLHDSKYSKEIAELRAATNKIAMEANHLLINIRAKFANETNRIYIEEINRIEAINSALKAELNAAERELVKHETIQKQIDQLDAQIKQKEAEKASIEEQLNAELDLATLIGKEGFLGNIFDEVLDEISAETNNTLSQIANTAHITINFKSERLTEKGTIKKTIVPVVNVNGNTGPLNSALSGGQITTVELAVDLAVGAVISRRTGVTPGYLILDESFAVGLDNVSKEACFELLKMYSHDRLILVIDHSTEFLSLFTKTITIEFKDGVSTIKEDTV